MAGNVTRNRWCFVPMCKNTDKSTPGKIFVSVPRNPSIRKEWWRAARREFPVAKAHIYCCEDHFNLKEDMENYLYYTMMGGYIKIRPGVTPHKFDCQGKITPHNENRDKLQRKRKVLQILSSKENIMEPHQNPAPQPDHVDQRMEHDGHVDPEPLTPSTQDTGIQVQVYPRKRSKGMQVQPVQADAMNNTDGHTMGKMKKTESTSEDSVSTSESSDVDHDKSKDYVPLDNTSSNDDDDDDNCKKLTLYTTRKLILKYPMEYIGLHKKHLYILDILCSHVTYKERGQIISNKDVVLIVLMTLHTGSPEHMIAHRFGVSNSCVSRILTRFLPVISDCLKELIYSSPSETIRTRRLFERANFLVTIRDY